MLECALLLVSFAMVEECLVSGVVLRSGQIVEILSITELNYKFVRIVYFMKCGVVLVSFAVKWVVKLRMMCFLRMVLLKMSVKMWCLLKKCYFCIV